MGFTGMKKPIDKRCQELSLSAKICIETFIRGSVFIFLSVFLKQGRI
ncbi:hypothetical protein SAMN05444412_11217 [Rhodonellum ikkaensis]|uniref:Uncharacterized protein n=1 Tax=Rhodonellum ikkaensis TaxID=336829 RepID=A0A1H3SJA0_9BACT|nr:hypothetical protein SAMN05444412_11217 [Rhodonellum ikkaensis]